MQEDENRLRRVLGPIGLTSLGIGAIIGAGIFVMTGRVAAQDAGPAIVVSFVVAGIGCAFAAFCYAEFASMAPVAGSAYTYAYATLGELFAWIIGWDLILEYAMGCATVAASWSKYLNEFLASRLRPEFGRPRLLVSRPIFPGRAPGFNLPAVLILVARDDDSGHRHPRECRVQHGAGARQARRGAVRDRRRRGYVAKPNWTTSPPKPAASRKRPRSSDIAARAGVAQEYVEKVEKNAGRLGP